MRITTKGQVTIPQSIREQLGLLPETEVEFEVLGNVVQIRKVQERSSRGRRLVNALTGKASSGMSTEEIMALTRGEP